MKLKALAMGIIILGITANQMAVAAPERLQIKDAEKRNKEVAAKAQIKNLNLQNIEDPEARRAIREILNYLSLN